MYFLLICNMPSEDRDTDDQDIPENTVDIRSLAKKNDPEGNGKEHLGVVEDRYLLGRGIFICCCYTELAESRKQTRQQKAKELFSCHWGI